jgi:hypothetical protein
MDGQTDKQMDENRQMDGYTLFSSKIKQKYIEVGKSI